MKFTVDTNHYRCYYGNAPRGAGRYAFARHWDEELLENPDIFFVDAVSFAEAKKAAKQYFKTGRVIVLT